MEQDWHLLHWHGIVITGVWYQSLVVAVVAPSRGDVEKACPAGTSQVLASRSDQRIALHLLHIDVPLSHGLAGIDQIKDLLILLLMLWIALMILSQDLPNLFYWIDNSRIGWNVCDANHDDISWVHMLN